METTSCSSNAAACVPSLSATPAAQNPGRRRQFELKAESPKFWELIARTQSWKRSRAVSDSPKGPVWDPAGISVRQRRGEEQALARVPRRPRRNGARDRRSRRQHARCERPAGDDRERSARDHSGGRRRQVQGARRQVRRQAVQQPERHHPRTGRRAVLHRSHPRLAERRRSRSLPYQGVFRLADGWIGAPADERSCRSRTAWHFRRTASASTSTTRSSARSASTTSAANGELKNGRLFGKEEGPRRCSRRHARRCRRERVRDRARRDLGVGSGRRAPRHDPAAGIRGQPQLGRCDYRTLYITARTSVYRLKTRRVALFPAPGDSGREHAAAGFFRGLRWSLVRRPLVKLPVALLNCMC